MGIVWKTEWVKSRRRVEMEVKVGREAKREDIVVVLGGGWLVSWLVGWLCGGGGSVETDRIQDAASKVDRERKLEGGRVRLMFVESKLLSDPEGRGVYIFQPPSTPYAVHPVQPDSVVVCPT